MLDRVVAVAVRALTRAAHVVYAGVITVDGAGGANFTEIQPAIDAAVNGDVIVVAAGDYSTLTSTVGPAGASIDAKGLTLIADPSGGLVKVTWLTIKDVAAGQRVVVRGVEVVGAPNALVNHGADVLNCAGAVVFEDCTMTGAPGFIFFHSVTPGRAGVKLSNVASATITRCALTGGIGVPGQPMFGYPPGDCGAGLEISRWSVASHDSVMTGRPPPDHVVRLRVPARAAPHQHA